ncbi:MAG: hypothetical protein Q8O89_03075 [Nanoarchaeota archaeon]|nr:hypothetical protein [Nanoarchaeota archaeon]
MDVNTAERIQIVDLDGIINKFVQLYIENEPFLIIGKANYHGQVLMHILEIINIPFESEKFSSGIIFPKKQGELYNVTGMGAASINLPKIKLYDDSFDYRLSPDKKHLEKLKPHCGEYKISIF